MYRKIKQKLGWAKPTKRHSDPSKGETPDQTINPETWQSEAKPGLGERLRRRRRMLSIYGVILFAIGGMLVVYGGRYAVDLISSPVTRAILSYGGLGVVAFVSGAKWQRGKIQGYDWLILQLDDGVLPMLGEFRPAKTKDGDNVFIPFEGFDWLGFRSRQLTLGELGDEITRAHAKRGREPDSPARIRVDDAITEVSSTAYGTVVGCLTGGLEIDTFGQESDVYTTPPNTVDESRLQSLKERLEQYVETVVPNLKNENAALEQQVANYRSRLQETDDDAVEKFVERHSRLLAAQETATGNDSDEAKGDGRPSWREIKQEMSDE